jgi:hypothetical protein
MLPTRVLQGGTLASACRFSVLKGSLDLGPAADREKQKAGKIDPAGWGGRDRSLSLGKNREVPSGSSRRSWRHL